MVFVNFICPEHGHVIGAGPNSRVECKCGKECAPEGLTPRQQATRYQDVTRKRRKAGTRKPVTRANARPVRHTAPGADSPV
ncbi:MAG: hypothetical protein ACXVXW_00400 [Mycobacteriaceae bacterium]